MQRIAVIAALAVSLSAWSGRAVPTNIKSVEAAAHGAYVAAINSNDTETLMADLTDDIVYQAPVNPKSSVKTRSEVDRRIFRRLSDHVGEDVDRIYGHWRLGI